MISVCPKTISTLHTYVEMKIFENSFRPNGDLQILGMLFTSNIPPHTTLGKVMPKTLAWSLQH
jgi:hypothetical protein